MVPKVGGKLPHVPGMSGQVPDEFSSAWLSITNHNQRPLLESNNRGVHRDQLVKAIPMHPSFASIRRLLAEIQRAQISIIRRLWAEHSRTGPDDKMPFLGSALGNEAASPSVVEGHQSVAIKRSNSPSPWNNAIRLKSKFYLVLASGTAESSESQIRQWAGSCSAYSPPNEANDGDLPYAAAYSITKTKEEWPPPHARAGRQPRTATRPRTDDGENQLEWEKEGDAEKATSDAEKATNRCVEGDLNPGLARPQSSLRTRNLVLRDSLLPSPPRDGAEEDSVNTPQPPSGKEKPELGDWVTGIDPTPRPDEMTVSPAPPGRTVEDDACPASEDHAGPAGGGLRRVAAARRAVPRPPFPDADPVALPGKPPVEACERGAVVGERRRRPQLLLRLVRRCSFWDLAEARRASLMFGSAGLWACGSRLRLRRLACPVVVPPAFDVFGCLCVAGLACSPSCNKLVGDEPAWATGKGGQLAGPARQSLDSSPSRRRLPSPTLVDSRRRRCVAVRGCLPARA
ncbi:hypothetical protein THAOC_14270 [Thalassiosira oceanica]|uniref:Uncharacterized protein n=1 Tax=Thalassiosira oceanica TaxID=159749 RepID=K0T3C5_THAOC|nr:hypothetical protein THAOC_14270 [Thalassiosira oceanica]|eukprot:EJK64937.1 hypothetical protein THAOC_14270 [Thalassiosira oceanica]